MRAGAAALAVYCLLGPASAEAAVPLRIPLTHYQLRNGLRVLLAEDFTLPLVSVAVVYEVGSLFDPPGKSGLAYLLENLMFLGSDNVGQMQHISHINRTGGTLNAATLEDRTLFYQVVPSNQLALVLWLESDRMKSLQITQAKVDAAKEELAAEIGRRVEETPYLATFFLFDRLLYPEPAFSHPVIGVREDIRSITVEDVQAFRRTHYVPNNALLCISGSFNTLQLRELVSRYFDTIPRGPEPPPPPQPQAYIKTLRTEAARSPRLPAPGFHLGFRIFNPRPSDLYGLTLIDYLLCRGKTSRLVKRVVKRERLASQITGGLERRGALMSYRIFTTNNSEVTAQLCLAAIQSELARLRSEFVPEGELAKVKNMFKQDIFRRLDSCLDRSLQLIEIFLSRSVSESTALDLERYLEVTPQVIAGLMNRYFTRDNSLVLFVQR